MWNFIAELASVLGFVLSVVLVLIGREINKRLEMFKDSYMLIKSIESFISSFNAHRKILMEYIEKREIMPSTLKQDILQDTERLFTFGIPDRKIKKTLLDLKSSCINRENDEACVHIGIIIPWLEKIKSRKDSRL